MSKLLSTYNAFFEGDKLLICDIDTWILAEWDLSTCDYRVVSRMMPIGKYGDHKKLGVVIGCYCVDGYIYCILRNTAQIIEVNTTTGKLIRHGLDYPVGAVNCILNANYYVYNNKIYLMPYDLDRHIIIFDLSTKSFFEGSIVSEMLGIGVKDIEGNKVNKYLFNGNNSFFAVSGTGIVAKIDIEEMRLIWKVEYGEIELVSLDGDANSMFAIGKAYSTIYRLGEDGNIQLIIDNSDSPNSCRVVKQIDDKLFAMGENGFLNVYLAPEYNTKINVVFPDTFSCVDELRCVHDIPFSGFVYNNGKIYLLPFSSNGMVEVDVNSLDAKYFVLALSDEDVNEEKSKKSEVQIEQKHFSLDDYIEYFLAN